MWAWPVAVPTWKLGDFGLMLVQDAPTSKYMPLAPESEMANELAETGVEVGENGTVVMGNGGVGLNLVGVVDKISYFIRLSHTVTVHNNIPD